MTIQLQPTPRFPKVMGRPIANPLPAFAATVAAIIRNHGGDETATCTWVAAALQRVVQDPDWISPALRVPSPIGYRRERLYEAPDGSFSIGCFVWGPGQRTPIHDHRAWGVIGAAIGTLESVSFYPAAGGGLVPSPTELIAAGTCCWAHPAGGDIHRIGAAGTETAVSIHVYGDRFDTICRNRYLPDGTVLTQ